MFALVKQQNLRTMKKAVIFTLGILALVLTPKAYGQTTNNVDSDEVTLNVRLYPIQTIVVNSSQKIVNLDYQTTDDYANGVALDQADHLNIYSTGGFQISAKSSTTTLESAHQDVPENIDASDIIITPSLGTSGLSGTNFQTISLTNQDQPIISNPTGGVNKTFNIKYEAAGADAYVTKYFNVENPTTYTTTVVYTLEAQ